MSKHGVVISDPNQKGGVAKTTTVVNCAAEAARRGNRVLLIDFDYQGNASAHLGIKHDALTSGRHTAAGLLGSGKPARECLLKTPFNNLFAIGSDIDFCEFHNLKSSTPGNHLILKDWIEPIRSDFDYIFIDVHPDLQLPFQNAMVASNYYLIPLFAEPDAIDGLHLMFQHLALIQEKLNPTLFMLGCVVSKVSRKNATHNKYLKLLEDFSKQHSMPILGTIRESNAVQGASDSQVPLVHYKPNLNVVRDYEELTSRVLEAARPNRRGRTPKTPTVTKEEVVKFMDAGKFEFEEEVIL